MKNWMVYATLLCIFLSTPVHADFASVTSRARLAVSFSSLYPLSRVTEAKTLATQLWTEINVALADITTRDLFEDSIVGFTDAVLELHLLCGYVTKDAQAQLNGVGSEYQHKNIQKTLEEIHYLADLVNELSKTFDKAMDGHVSDQAACVKIVLENITKKMERTLLSAP